MWFEAILGLRINLIKSEIIPIGWVDNVGELVVELGCGIDSLPSSCLGLPLRGPHKSMGVWETIEERFCKKMASWKRQYISKRKARALCSVCRRGLGIE